MDLPPLERPIYAFLGECDWVDPVRPCSIRIPLAAFTREAITFTCPDSMASLPLGTCKTHRRDRRPYHGHVFTLEEIERVVAEFGLPGARTGPPPSRYATFIEVQIWDVRPLYDDARSVRSHPWDKKGDSPV